MTPEEVVRAAFQAWREGRIDDIAELIPGRGDSWATAWVGRGHRQVVSALLLMWFPVMRRSSRPEDLAGELAAQHP